LTDPSLQDWINKTLHPKPAAAHQPHRPSTPNQHEEQPGIWPRDKLLGSNADLAKQPAMTVRTPGSPPAHFYWRATSYDKYTGHGWLTTTSVVPSVLDANLWPVSTDPPQGYALLRQEFELAKETRQIYAAGRPVRLNLPAN